MVRSVAFLSNPKVVALLTSIATLLVGYVGLVVVGQVPPPKTVPEVNDEENDSSVVAFAVGLLAFGTSFLALGLLSRRGAWRAWGLGTAAGALVVAVSALMA
jgi:hypothetical protein